MSKQPDPDPEPNTQAERHYMAYLLRLWLVSGSGASQARWQASLEIPLTHEKHNFSNLQSLFAYLEAETELEREK